MFERKKFVKEVVEKHGEEAVETANDFVDDAEAMVTYFRAVCDLLMSFGQSMSVAQIAGMVRALETTAAALRSISPLKEGRGAACMELAEELCKADVIIGVKNNDQKES